MLKISKLADYATTLLTHMAAARPSDSGASAALLAEQTRLPHTTVAKLLKQLGKAGLVNATRGAHGGYCLARAPKEITVADIICAMEGPLGLTDCAAHDHHCARAGFCGTKAHWRTINNAIAAALKAVTLENLAGPSSGLTLRTQSETTFQFARLPGQARAHLVAEQTAQTRATSEIDTRPLLMDSPT
jgi:FeS assembly SUF system regulator